VDAALRTFHTPRDVFEDESYRADAEVDPTNRLVPMVVSGTNSPPLAAAGPTPGRLYLNDETSLPQIDTGNEKIGNSDQKSGKLGYAHGFPFLSEVFVNIRKNGKSCVFIYTGNESRKFMCGLGQTAATGISYPLSMQESLFC
jgi:hypothetical protein